MFEIAEDEHDNSEMRQNESSNQEAYDFINKI
jgi:hypothetical protein